MNWNRRRVIATSLGMSTAALWTPGVFADLVATPTQTEGPFYPDKLPLDTDNDLLVINENLTPAVGEITHVSGKVLDVKGNPLRNAFVEIWQCDNNGVYLHSGDTTNRANQEKNFQGYGRFLTDSKGQYYFRTIKPVPYPGRTPHIHFAVSRSGKRALTTSLYVAGHEQNEGDSVLKRLKSQAERESIIRDFSPIKDSKLGELAVDFDLVLGMTPNEDEQPTIRGVAPSDRSKRSLGL